MLDRYTESVRRVLVLAREEAVRRRATAVGVDHLLLGLLRQGMGLSKLLERDGLSYDRLAGTMAASADAAASSHIPFAADTARALTVAEDEADRLGHRTIATHHLLLGALGEAPAAARDILREHGAGADALRDEVRDILEHIGRARTPSVAPSRDVHIAPSRLSLREGTRGTAAPDYWSRQGFDLKAVVAEVFGVDESRIEWPKTVDDAARYDIEVLLPEFEGTEEIHRLVRAALQEHFGLTIAPEARETDVYVLTTAPGPAPNRRAVADGGGFFMMNRGWSSSTWEAGPPGIRGMREMRRLAAGSPPSGFSGTVDMPALCAALAEAVGRPFVDETGLTGNFEISVESTGDRLEEFLAALRDQAGLIATPGRRDVTLLVVRER